MFLYVVGIAEWSIILSISPCHDDWNRDKILTRAVLDS